MAFAKVEWTVNDVLSMTEDPDNDYEPTITAERAQKFLYANESLIMDRLMEVGWDIIADLMQQDGLL